MKNGIYQLTMMEYLALDALSSGTVHTLLAESPYHARHGQISERTSSKEADIGTFAHAMLLEGGTDALVIVDAKDWKTNAAKDAREVARAEGKLAILAHKVKAVENMVDAAYGFLSDCAIGNFLKEGKSEQTLIWTETHDDGEVLCKARPDWLSDRYMIHYKTTLASVNPRAFTRIVGGSGYDTAMLFYHRGLEALLLDNDVGHYLLAQEQSAPYACKLFDLTNARADVAERQVERAIGIWARCLASGQWPAYDGSVHSIDLTPWELAQAEEDMLSDGELSGGIPA